MEKYFNKIEIDIPSKRLYNQNAHKLSNRMIKVLNAFPNSFLPEAGYTIEITGITEKKASSLLQEGFESFVGHASFADVLSARLGVKIPVNRNQASANGQVLVCAVNPPRRLAEGEIWTEQEILSMPIVYALIHY